jgi:hypothetical protein
VPGEVNTETTEGLVDSAALELRCQARFATLLLPLVAIRLDEAARTYTH